MDALTKVAHKERTEEMRERRQVPINLDVSPDECEQHLGRELAGVQNTRLRCATRVPAEPLGAVAQCWVGIDPRLPGDGEDERGFDGHSLEESIRRLSGWLNRPVANLSIEDEGNVCTHVEAETEALSLLAPTSP